VAAVTVDAAPADAPRDRVAGIDVALDIAAPSLGEDERGRLEKELEKVAGEMSSAEGRLGNRQFTEKAPAAVVEGTRQRLEELRERHRRIAEQLG
jgi:valyl-tRNA synthetase